MYARLLVAAICVNAIYYPSFSLDILATQGNVVFTKDFEEIERLGQAKDAVGFDKMVKKLKSRWKDSDMDGYCRLMYQLLGRLRTDFDPVDHGKLKALSTDVLTDLEKIMEQGIDPVLVPHYYDFQTGYISNNYASKYSDYSFKGDIEDEVWVSQRRDVILRLMKVWKFIQDAKDPNWSIDTELYGNVRPPDGLPFGTTPDSIKDPDLRAKYEADIKINDEKRRWWGAQYRLHNTEDQLKIRLNRDIQVMYNTPPLAPDELKSLLDLYVKDEAQKKMFLEAGQK